MLRARHAGEQNTIDSRADTGTTMHGITMSARSKHHQAQLIAELTLISSRIFGQRQLWKAANVDRARTELGFLVTRAQTPARPVSGL